MDDFDTVDGVNVEPMQKEGHMDYESLALMQPDVDIKVRIFRIYPNDKNGELEEYSQLLNDMYDEDSEIVYLQSLDDAATWTQDGAYQKVVHYGVLPENDEEDEADENYTDY